MKLRRDHAPSLAAAMLLGLATALSSGWPEGPESLAAGHTERGCVL
jgi:hypothetical protein